MAFIDYLEIASADYSDVYLTQSANYDIPMPGSYKQIVNDTYGGSRDVSTLKTTPNAVATIKFTGLTQSEHDILSDYYYNPAKAYGMGRSYVWQHPQTLALYSVQNVSAFNSTATIMSYGRYDVSFSFKILGTFNDFIISEIGVLEHDPATGQYSSLVMIDPTHFILAYTGDGSDGYIKTFSIDGNYDNITEIDVLEHDTGYAVENSLVMIDPTHFILAYTGDGADGYIKTFSIDGNYDNITEIDVLEHDTSNCRSSSLVLVDSTHLILAYWDVTATKGYIKTFSIDGSYDNITQLHVHNHETYGGNKPSLVKIDATHYIFAYLGATSSRIKTLVLDSGYDITDIDMLSHSGAVGNYYSLVLIDATHFALAYQSFGAIGRIKTFSIDGAYDNITEIDSYDVTPNPAGLGAYSSLVLINSTHLALAYSDGNDDGFIGTFSIDGNYDNITEIDVLEHDTVNGTYNSLVLVGATRFMLAYTGADSDGFVKTFLIE